jgi:hypothetical protein
LICPDCGYETTESADTLRSMAFYSCPEDGCDYRFEIVAAPDYAKGFADACKRLYAALSAMSRPRSGQGFR